MSAATAVSTTTKAAKCVVWDLDDTLWSGTLTAGDETTPRPGVEEILRTLDSRGILLSIASKNNYEDAAARLEELGLLELFLEPQITWGTKSESIATIREKLNIGMDTIMFIDDQAFERDEVTFSHPQVETVDAADYASLLEHPRLNPAVVTDDARRRRAMYLENKERDASEARFTGPREDFLAGLDMRLMVSRAEEADLDRLEELTLRTNQLNSTGIHFSRAELAELMVDESHELWVCELVDVYGSYGKVGMALVRRDGNDLTIRLLLMSCRTVSKGIGTVLLTFLLRRAAEQGAQLFADLRRTDRNRQMVVTYQLAGFTVVSQDGDHYRYHHALTTVPQYPDYLQVDVHDH